MSDKPLLLIIEDSQLYQQHLISLCEQNNYDYIVVDDGLKAVETLYSMRPDLVLLDVNLPGMFGYDVCTQMRKIPSHYHTPVIFLTSSDKQEDIVRAFDVGGNDFVSKPFNDVVLHSRIKNQLEQVYTKKMLNSYILKLEQINNDLTVQKELSEHLASRDHLTGIYNRRYTQNAIIETVEEKRLEETPHALALFDIDDFKYINDTYGHMCGDYVLKKVVTIISNTIKEHDILGRWGGEEFVLFMPSINLDDAVELVDSIRKNVSAALFTYDYNTFQLTITAGLATFDESSDYDQVFSLIDEALYEGKNNGKNQVVIKDDFIGKYY